MARNRARTTRGVAATTPAHLLSPADVTPPSVPANLALTPGDSELSFSFDASPEGDVAGYEYRVDSGSPVECATSGTITGLINGVSYDVQVRSYDDTGNYSAWSSVVSATPVASERYALLADPNFDSSTDLTADQRTWYDRLNYADQTAQSSGNLSPDPYTMTTGGAHGPDSYDLARPVGTHTDGLLHAFAVTGDLNLLDRVYDLWRDAVDNLGDRALYSDDREAPDGYREWLWQQSSGNELYQSDYNVLEEAMLHAIVARVAFAFENNRTETSPSAYDYATLADDMYDYLKNDFEAKWRDRDGLTASDYDYCDHTLAHSYLSLAQYHHFMYRLTGEVGYATERDRRISNWLANTATEDGGSPTRTGRVYSHGVLTDGNVNEDYLPEIIYVQYVYDRLLSLYMENVTDIDATLLSEFANSVSLWTIDNGTTDYASCLGGDYAAITNEDRAGIRFWGSEGGESPDSRETTARVNQWSLFTLSAWDSTGETEQNITDNNEAVEGAQYVDEPWHFFMPCAGFLSRTLS